MCVCVGGGGGGEGLLTPFFYLQEEDYVALWPL